MQANEDDRIGLNEIKDHPFIQLENSYSQDLILTVLDAYGYREDLNIVSKSQSPTLKDLNKFMPKKAFG